MAGGDDTLRALLMQIAADAAGQAGAIADTIQGAFAIQMEDARRHAPEHQRAAILHGLALARDSALAAAAAKAAIDVQGRQKAAIAFRLAQQSPARQHAHQVQRGAEKSVASVAAQTGSDADTEADARRPTTRARAIRGRAFRRAAKTATRRTASRSHRTWRGGRRGETGRDFKPAARATMRSVFRIPGAADPVAPFLSTTLDWFELWDAGSAAADQIGGHFDAYQKHLSPGL
jgi:hypothetical protein